MTNLKSGEAQLVNSLALHFSRWRPELLSEHQVEQQDIGDVISKGVTEIERIRDEYTNQEEQETISG